MSVGTHVTAIPVRQFGGRMHVELHHLILPVPIGVKEPGPIRETRVIDEMVDHKAL